MDIVQVVHQVKSSQRQHVQNVQLENIQKQPIHLNVLIVQLVNTAIKKDKRNVLIVERIPIKMEQHKQHVNHVIHCVEQHVSKRQENALIVMMDMDWFLENVINVPLDIIQQEEPWSVLLVRD